MGEIWGIGLGVNFNVFNEDCSKVKNTKCEHLHFSHCCCCCSCCCCRLRCHLETKRKVKKWRRQFYMLQQRTLQHTRRIHHHQNKCNLHIFKKNCKIRMLDLAGNSKKIVVKFFLGKCFFKKEGWNISNHKREQRLKSLKIWKFWKSKIFENLKFLKI